MDTQDIDNEIVRRASAHYLVNSVPEQAMEGEVNIQQNGVQVGV